MKPSEVVEFLTPAHMGMTVGDLEPFDQVAGYGIVQGMAPDEVRNDVILLRFEYDGPLIPYPVDMFVWVLPDSPGRRLTRRYGCP